MTQSGLWYSLQTQFAAMIPKSMRALAGLVPEDPHSKEFIYGTSNF